MERLLCRVTRAWVSTKVRWLLLGENNYFQILECFSLRVPMEENRRQLAKNLAVLAEKNNIFMGSGTLQLVVISGTNW